MANNVMGIGVSVFLRDHFTSRAARVQGSMRNLHSSAMRMQRDMLQSIRAQNMGIAAIGGLAMVGMGRAVKIGAEFGYTMQYVASITEANNEQQEAAKDKALALGKATIFTARQVASGMRYMAMAGMEHEQILGNIEAAANLAGATLTNLEGKGGAADIMTNIMTTFQKDATESTRVSDILTAVTNSTNTSLFDLGQALAYAGSTVHRLGIPLEEATTMLGLLGNQAIQGSIGGTSLANMFRFLSKAVGDFGTAKQDKALSQLGLSPEDLKDARGELLPTHELLKKFLYAAERQSKLKQTNLLTALFGIRGEKGIGPLINQLNKYEDVINKVHNSHGLSARMMGKQMGTLEGQFKALTSAGEALMTRFTENIKPVLLPIVKIIRGLVNAITAVMEIPVLGTLLTTGVAGWVLIRTAAAAYKVVLTSIVLMRQAAAGGFARQTAAEVAGWNARTAAARRYKAAATAPYFVAPGGGRVAPGPIPKGSKFMGGRVNPMAWTGGVTAAAATTARAGTGILSRFAPMFSRFLGFLGGPWGLALSFGLPAVIGLLTSSVDKNTEAQNKANEEAEKATYYDTARYSAEGYFDTSAYKAKIQRLAAEKGVPDSDIAINPVTGKAMQTAPVVNVHLDGIKVGMEKVAEDTLRGNLEYIIQ